MKSANRIGAATSVALLLAAFALAPLAAARADDFGPRGDVRDVRFAAERLLAHSARDSRGESRAIKISDVVVVKDAALLSWDIGEKPNHGMMGLVRLDGRWWDALDISMIGSCWDITARAFPLAGDVRQTGSVPTPASLLSNGLPADLVAAAATHNADVRDHPDPKPPASPARHILVRPGCFDARYAVVPVQPISPAGGSSVSFRSNTSGYEIAVHYAANNAAGAFFEVPYARAPTQAEIIPYPTTYHFVSNAVVYFDGTIYGTKPVTFAPGTTIDIWFPFVLDDTLQYDLTIGFADRPIGPIYAKPFDNVLHYTLPGFTVTPGQTLMAEIDGNRP